VLYIHLQNILEQYISGSLMCLEEKQIKVAKLRVTVKECKFSCVNKDWLLMTVQTHKQTHFELFLFEVYN